jgi:aconitase A
VGQKLTLIIRKGDQVFREPVTALLNTEVEYYKHDGVLPYVLRQIADEK